MDAVSETMGEVNQVVRTSKRKRNQVSYYEPIEESEDDSLSIPDLEECSEDEDYSETANKKLKFSKLADLNRVHAKRRRVRPFPFLKLPAELRNKIYEYCLVDRKGLALVSQTKSYRRGVARQQLGKMPTAKSPKHSYNPHQDRAGNKCQSLNPALLAVNRQMHREGVAYLYGQRIHIEDTTVLHTFVSLIGKANREQLRDLVVHSWGEGRGVFKHMNYPGLTALAGCTGLEHVFFDCILSSWRHRQEDGAKWIARQLFRDGFIWLEAAAAANGVGHMVSTMLRLHKNNFVARRWEKASDEEKEEDEKMLKEGTALFNKELRRLINGER